MSEEPGLVVVGGGPVGTVLALALVRAGFAPTVLEPRPAEGAQAPLRPVALSYGSRLILERLDAWARFAPATPIERIHVSQRAGFGRAMLAARDVGLPALGYVVDYAGARAALASALARHAQARVVQGTVTRIESGHDRARVAYSRGATTGELETRLVVIADGGGLLEDVSPRTIDYRQSAVVAIVSTEQAHRNLAFERFTATGPLALLPYGDRCALIWCARPEQAQGLAAMSGDAFVRELERAFGGRLGEISGVEQRAVFPLGLKVTTDSHSPRVVRIGNAAQTLHPVAGQGLNLGLRDAWELAAALARIAPDDIGSSAACAAFRARRRIDRAGGIGFTDLLVRGYSNEYAPLRAVRGVALTALGCVPPARDFLVRKMSFGVRA